MNNIELHETDLQKFNITDAAIAEMRKEYLTLKVSDIDDRAGLEKVHSARMIIKSKRVEVEKVRKELKEDALKYGRLVDAEAKRITSLLEPIESHLTNEEKKVEDEKLRIKQEEEQRRREKIEYRQKLLLGIEMRYEITGYTSAGVYISNEQINTLPDEEFEPLYNSAKKEYDAMVKEKAEKERLAKEESERLEKQRLEQEAEAERLSKIKAEQDEKELKLKTEQEELNRKKIKDRGYRLFSLGLRWDGENYKAEGFSVHISKIKELSDPDFDSLVNQISERAEEIKKAAEEKRKAELEAAKIQAAKETEARLKKEAESKRIAEEKEKKRLAREASLKPDKDKLLSFISNLRNLDLPKLKTKEGKEILNSYADTLKDSLIRFEKQVKEMK